jgi:hypothetical protein
MPRTKQDTAIPAGFTETPAEGGFGSQHDFKKTPLLVGKCVKIEKVTTRYGKQDSMTIKDTAGNLKSLWNSAMLSGLFKKRPIGKQVFVLYKGTQKIKGKKEPMKLFTCGVK